MDDDSDLFAFAPVPLRSRRDGWTPERQRRFIALLAQGMPSNRAARAVGMSKQTAHQLRRRLGAESFAAAWDAAAHAGRVAKRGIPCLATTAAIEGASVPVVYRGRIVGSRIRYDNRQLARLIGRACPGPLFGPSRAEDISSHWEAELWSSSDPLRP